VASQGAGQVIRRIESHFDGAGGRRLFGRSWLPERPRRSLLLVHGYGEHSGRYEHVAAWFAQRGSAVHAYDHQGHGLSAGPRCHVRHFDDFLDDLDVAVDRAWQGGGELPRFVVGHSLGGLIVSTWARERQPKLSGLVVSAPALSSPDVSRSRLATLRVMRRVLPTLSVQSRLEAEALSRDPTVVASYLSDPLVNLETTLSLAAEVFAAMRRTAPGGAGVTLPTLMLQGAEDRLCDPAASERFARAVADCRYRCYPGLRHEIFNEPEQEQVFEDVQRWMLEQEGAQAPA